MCAFSGVKVKSVIHLKSSVIPRNQLTYLDCQRECEELKSSLNFEASRVLTSFVNSESILIIHLFAS